MALPTITNPIRVTAAETWVFMGQGHTVKSIVWQGITADGSELILAKKSDSAESSRICRRIGKEDIDVNVLPGGPTSFSYLYVEQMDSGFLEVNLE